MEEIIIKIIKCADTRATHESYVFPAQLNNSQIQFGGETLRILDANAGLAGVKFLPGNLSFVTAGYDHVQFLSPAQPNEILTCISYVTGSHKRAVEVFTKFLTTDTKTKEVKVAFIAFCTLIVTNDMSEIHFPKLIAESDEEKYLLGSYGERLKERNAELADNKAIISHLNLK
ncbi:acyl-CoA thioester hydrolase [Lentilactobacillus otakiensis]|uniref:acyl-CoA thioester hydrolase n=1 Tax=Lentilactobacillus otakiensis TaxID=481720 RepID=UPI000A608203|nr:acyl-CoA thioester hydrolase [Lentilactobacillus otakiensis]